MSVRHLLSTCDGVVVKHLHKANIPSGRLMGKVVLGLR